MDLFDGRSREDAMGEAEVLIKCQVEFGATSTVAVKAFRSRFVSTAVTIAPIARKYPGIYMPVDGYCW
jgi:hypothetical protein